MRTFSAVTQAEALVPADRAAIWAVLTDPELLPRLTPFLTSIETEGDCWTWHMGRIPLLGTSITPAFTEQMTFTPHERIDYHHQPPDGARERAGVTGHYLLAAEEGGTRLATSLTVKVELPLPRLATPAVTLAMNGVLATMGDRFSRNLLRHLGLPA